MAGSLRLIPFLGPLPDTSAPRLGGRRRVHCIGETIRLPRILFTPPLDHISPVTRRVLWRALYCALDSAPDVVVVAVVVVFVVQIPADRVVVNFDNRVHFGATPPTTGKLSSVSLEHLTAKFSLMCP